jgi:hypothetical protein
MPIRNLHSRLRRRLGCERGISTIEWIGLTAVVLVLLSGIIVYVQVHGGEVGSAAGSSMDEQIALWESGGGRGTADSAADAGPEISPFMPGAAAPLDGADFAGVWPLAGDGRLQTAIDLLRNTPTGREIAENILTKRVGAGDTGRASAWSCAGCNIIVNPRFLDDPVGLAILLAHEGTHVTAGGEPEAHQNQAKVWSELAQQGHFSAYVGLNVDSAEQFVRYDDRGPAVILGSLFILGTGAVVAGSLAGVRVWRGAYEAQYDKRAKQEAQQNVPQEVKDFLFEGRPKGDNRYTG